MDAAEEKNKGWREKRMQELKKTAVQDTGPSVMRSNEIDLVELMYCLLDKIKFMLIAGLVLAAVMGLMNRPKAAPVYYTATSKLNLMGEAKRGEKLNDLSMYSQLVPELAAARAGARGAGTRLQLFADERHGFRKQSEQYAHFVYYGEIWKRGGGRRDGERICGGRKKIYLRGAWTHRAEYFRRGACADVALQRRAGG